jgi:hypothetical protein
MTASLPAVVGELVAAHELVERLQKTVADLGEHRQTHVVWRDWLRKDPANANINPHAGSAEFHHGVIGDYDRHLANINEAIATLSALTAEAGKGEGLLDRAREWIGAQPHGDNCYLDPDHPLGRDCHCGKESILSALWHHNERTAEARKGEEYVDPLDVFLSQGTDDVPCLQVPGRVLARFIPGSWDSAYDMFSGNTPLSTATPAGEG